MMELDKKGFTLVELVAVIVLLSLIMSIGGYTITTVIKNSREKEYQILMKNINNAVEEYYIECRYADDNNTCQSQINLGYLVTNGYMDGNATDSNDFAILVNPVLDNENISGCDIKYTYSDGKINIEAVNPSDICPTTCDYNPYSVGC